MMARQCIICERTVDDGDGHLRLSAFEDHCICATCLQSDHPG